MFLLQLMFLFIICAVIFFQVSVTKKIDKFIFKSQH